MANTNVLHSIPFGLRSPESPFVSLPLPALKSLFSEGLRLGGMTRLEGRRSSGCTAVGLHMLAQATGRGEICAVVDVQDQFHVESAAKAGVRLDHLVWIRCNGNADKAMHAVDLLLHAGGFGIVWLDFCEVSPRVLNRIPLSYGHRFRRVLEDTPTSLLLSSTEAGYKPPASNVLQLKVKAADWAEEPALVRNVNTVATLQRPSGPRSESLYLQAVV